MTTTTHKRCRRCGHTKRAAEFSKDSHKSDGLRSYCKSCNVILVTGWRRRHGQEWADYMGRWRLKTSWKGRVVTTEADLRAALKSPEPFYAIPQQVG